MEIGARGTAAKDTMSATVKLTNETEKSTSDDIDYGLYDVLPRRVAETNALFPSLGQVIAG